MSLRESGLDRVEQRGTGGLRDALLVRIMSDCLLRGAEAVALDVSDIAFADGWLRLYVRRSKTDQEGRGVVFYAGGEPSAGVREGRAPRKQATARLARRWLEAADIAGGPLFRPVNKAGRTADERLTLRSVRSIVKRCAGDSGVGGRVSGHALGVWKTAAAPARHASPGAATAHLHPRGGTVPPACMCPQIPTCCGHPGARRARFLRDAGRGRGVSLTHQRCPTRLGCGPHVPNRYADAPQGGMTELRPTSPR